MNSKKREKHSHISALSSEAQIKLEKSYIEAEGLDLRDIKCPHCKFVITRVYSDVQGHYLARCRKCKSEMVLNFAYFRRQKGIGSLKQKYYSK